MTRPVRPVRVSEWHAVGNSGFGTAVAAEDFARLLTKLLGCTPIVEPLMVNGEATCYTVVRVSPSYMVKADELRMAFDAGWSARDTFG